MVENVEMTFMTILKFQIYNFLYINYLKYIFSPSVVLIIGTKNLRWIVMR